MCNMRRRAAAHTHQATQRLRFALLQASINDGLLFISISISTRITAKNKSRRQTSKEQKRPQRAVSSAQEERGASHDPMTMMSHVSARSCRCPSEKPTSVCGDTEVAGSA
jgi:hypothetical protein